MATEVEKARKAVEWSLRKVQMDIRLEETYQEMLERTCSLDYLDIVEGYGKSKEAVVLMTEHQDALTTAVSLLKGLEREEGTNSGTE